MKISGIYVRRLHTYKMIAITFNPFVSLLHSYFRIIWHAVPLSPLLFVGFCAYHKQCDGVLHKCSKNGFLSEQKQIGMPPSENAIQIQIGVAVCSTLSISFTFICYHSKMQMKRSHLSELRLTPGCLISNICCAIDHRCYTSISRHTTV